MYGDQLDCYFRDMSIMKSYGKLALPMTVSVLPTRNPTLVVPNNKQIKATALCGDGIMKKQAHSLDFRLCSSVMETA